MKRPDETRELALKVYRETNSPLAAARAVGVHRDTIYRWINNYGAARYQPELITPIHIPLDVMAERDERLAKQPRDLTAAFFGDPLPGYSALERR
jgi:transposase-like protein